MARMPASELLRKFFRVPHPALNVFCHDEPTTTDSVYSDEPANDNGATAVMTQVLTQAIAQYLAKYCPTCTGSGIAIITPRTPRPTTTMIKCTSDI